MHLVLYYVSNDNKIVTFGSKLTLKLRFVFNVNLMEDQSKASDWGAWPCVKLSTSTQT